MNELDGAHRNAKRSGATSTHGNASSPANPIIAGVEPSRIQRAHRLCGSVARAIGFACKAGFAWLCRSLTGTGRPSTQQVAGILVALAVAFVCSLSPVARGQPVFEEFTEARAADDVTSITISTPGGTGQGDLLIAAVAVDGDVASSLAPPGGEGWTQIELDSSSGVTFGVWWKLAADSESPMHQWTWLEGQETYTWMMRFTGGSSDDPIHTVAINSGNSSSPTCPSVTTTISNTLILRLGGFDDDDIIVDSPGLPGHIAITMDASGWDRGTTSGGAGYVTQDAMGPSGTTTFSLTAFEGYRTVTIAIAPECGVDGDCDDTLYCTGVETCVGGSCQPGSDPCPGQMCDEVNDVCAECLGDGDCDDTLYCTGVETCVGGACQPGSDPCPGQMCDEVNDVCAECLGDGDCDDTLYCTGVETCVGGSCQPGSDPCPGQMCDEVNDVCAECLGDGDCDDTLYCTGVETCVGGACQPGSDPCPGQMCDEVNDVCAECLDDGDCDDTLYCTGVETCVGGSCQPGSDPCPGQMCDEVNDVCAECLGDGDCDDTLYCTGVETCVGGACQPGSDPCSP